ncbi:MAG: redox-sensing transcriptional repressor Rex [Clostridiales bacterium]|jgi:redox-sensing transcriptional repressor|nr:redox-sensing transcriptional repressor Rex [Clostridiales bacterium]
MGNPAKPIPAQAFRRLPAYYNVLSKLRDQGIENVSSTVIAGKLALNDVVVRKDLAAVSENGGKPRMGYVVRDLMGRIGGCLGYYGAREAVLVGAGQLGRALLSYSGFDNYGVKILAAFDVDEGAVGLGKNGKPVMGMQELPGFCRRMNIRIGVITVPESAAQAVCDTLVSSGVLAVWNFAPTHLNVPERIFVHNENMAISLSLLSQHLAESDGRQPAARLAP